MDIKDLELMKIIISVNSKNVNECHIWTGKLTRHGYGYFYFLKKCWAAHRAAYYAYHKNLPENMHICHKCHNKKCVNPDHLFSGTPKENSADNKLNPKYKEYLEKASRMRKRNTAIKECKIEAMKNFHKKGYELEFMTVSEFADKVRLHPNTVYKMIKNGDIFSCKSSGGSKSHYRIPTSELETIYLKNMSNIIDTLVGQRISGEVFNEEISKIKEHTKSKLNEI